MISRLDPELIIESEKTAARVRQELKSLQKTQGERSSRRQLGLEAEAVPDDPELFLRLSHRASHNTHGAANGVARRGAAGTGAEEGDEEEKEIDSSGKRERGFPDRPSVLKQEDLDLDLDLDDDMSGTSLSMSSSTTSLIALASDPVESTNNGATAEAATPGMTKTEEQGHTELSATVAGTDGVHSGEQEKHSMDIDTPQLLQNDNDNDSSTNGIVTTTSSSLSVDSSTTASTSMEEKLVAADRDLEMTSDNHAINGSPSYTPGSPTTATTTEPTQSAADETMDTSVADPIIPDQDPTAPEYQDPEPIKEQTPTPPPVLILDSSEVALLRQALVDKTDTSTIEELDQLRAALYEDLWEHRLQWDKGPMLLVNNFFFLVLII